MTQNYEYYGPTKAYHYYVVSSEEAGVLFIVKARSVFAVKTKIINEELITGITSAAELRMLTEIEDLSITETNMYVAK